MTTRAARMLITLSLRKRHPLRPVAAVNSPADPLASGLDDYDWKEWNAAYLNRLFRTTQVNLTPPLCYRSQR